MLRRTSQCLVLDTPHLFRQSLREREVDSHLNMDRVYRNLAMEKRDHMRPWTFEKDMRGAVMHLTIHSPTKPLQVIGTILDVSHNETNLDAWVRLFYRKGKVFSWLQLPLMNPMIEYKIVRDRDEVKNWENYVKDMGHQKIIFQAGKAKRSRIGSNSLFW
ncbi:hypothetical protein DIPPA_07163 [Diplonema papillatum]|nr:hypothetical protein DIPPA_07163 [Diplonema papillatum]